MAEDTVQNCIDRNPYIGPRPFRPGEAFHGRERDASQLQDMLISNRIVLLHAPSGAGKTSLIQAAIVPYFQQRGYAMCTRPDPHLSALRVNEPLPEFSVLNRYVYSLVLGLVGHLVPSPAELASTSLNDALVMLSADGDPPPRQLLVIDQLEEALTLSPADLDGQRELFRQLGQALDHNRRWALLSMREDYMGGLDPFLRLIPGRLRSTYRLDFLDRTSAMHAIRAAAADRDVDVEVAAAEKLVDDLGRLMMDQSEKSAAPPLKVRHVEPVLLQVVCHRLWRKLCRDRVGRIETIGVSDLEQFGRVDDALRRYYAEVVREASGNDVHIEHMLRDWIDRELITEDGFRAQQRSSPPIRDSDAALEVLLDRYLIRKDARAGWRELYHDRLIAPVRQDNASWRRRHLEPWQIDAGKWYRNHEDDSYLLSGDSYRRAKRSLASLGDRASDVERRFVERSGERQTRESALRKIEGRGNVLAALLSVSMLVNIALVLWLVWR